MSKNNQAGKGSKPRPVDKKLFDKNFNQIAWKSSPEQSKNQITKKSNRTIYKY